MRKGHNRPTEELRRRAEKRLQKIKQKVTISSKPAELERLVHELEVHQIELEMQNEELLQARSELEAYLSKYTDLYDFAPVGYFTLDPNGLIRQANLTGARMLGVERSRLANQHFGRFVTADYRPAIAPFLAKVFQSHSQETSVLELQKEGGGKFFVYVEARVSEEGRECHIALIDITAQKQVEDALRESEQKYRALFETMSQGVVHQAPDRKIISANPAAERILGLSTEQIKGKTWTDLRWRVIHEDGSDFPEETHPSMVALRTGKAVLGVVMGLFLPNADGYLWLNINAVPQFLPGEDRPFQVFVTFEDISDHKRLVVYNKLTTREKEVFKLLVKGLTRQIIAETLDISSKTVDKHRENLMEKLNLYTIEGLVQFARLLGLVEY